MQVPVMIGKEGKLISYIKKVTRTHIMVHGPYDEYLHQNVEIWGDKTEDVAKACFLIYLTVWKALKHQPMTITPQ